MLSEIFMLSKINEYHRERRNQNGIITFYTLPTTSLFFKASREQFDISKNIMWHGQRIKVKKLEKQIKQLRPY